MEDFINKSKLFLFICFIISKEFYENFYLF